jgi:hypothetical protein
MPGATLYTVHHEGQLCCSRRLYDNRAAHAIFWMPIEQLPTHLNAHRATLGASLMSLEQQQKMRQTGNQPIRFTSPWVNHFWIHADLASEVFWMRIEQIWKRIEHPLSVFKIKIWFERVWSLSIRPSKTNIKLKSKFLKFFFTSRRHMYILVAFELHYFQALLNWWHSPFTFPAMGQVLS